MSKTTSAREWSSKRRRRAVSLVPLLAAIVGSAAPAQATSTQSTIWIVPTLEVSPGAITLCPNDSAYVYVTYRAVLQRTNSQAAPVQGQPVSGVTISGSVSNTSVGQLATATTATQSWRGGTSALFTIVAGDSFGHTTVEFAAQGFRAPLKGPNGEDVVLVPPAPLTIDVDVTCEYSVTAVSAWVLPGERQLYTFGVFSARLTPDADGTFSNIPATLNSSALWVGPCPGTSVIESSGVMLSGYVGQGRFAATVDYQPANTTTTEGCKGKSSSGPGQPQSLQFEVSALGGSAIEAHTLDTYVAVAGTTDISVIPLGP